MTEIVFMVEEDPDGGFSARAAGEAIFTQGDDIDSLKSNVREAVRCHFEDSDRPSLIRLHWVRDEVIAA
jgi:predicted RNase H-like HicB family nuclease